MSGQGIPFKRIDKQYDNAPSVTSKLDGKQKAIFALLNLQDYVNGLIIQWNRIISAEEARFRRSDHGSSYWLAATAIDLDIHYYVICWDKIEKNRKQLMSIIRQKEIGIAWREVKNVLTKVGDLRNFYEHLDQRTIQARGIQLTSNGILEIKYSSESGGNDKSIKLGRIQVEDIMKAYEKTISVLNAI